MRSTKLNVSACVTVLNARAFSWLGHMPVLSWTMAQLAEVRGITDTSCYAVPDLKAQASKILNNFSVCALPAGITTQVLRSWLVAEGGPVADADVVLLVDPVTPFVPASKLESLIRAVRKGGVAMLGRSAPIGYVRKGMYDETTSAVPVPGVVAYAADAVRDPSWRSKVSIVEVGGVEAINAADPDGWQLASALIAAGAR